MQTWKPNGPKDPNADNSGCGKQKTQGVNNNKGGKSHSQKRKQTYRPWDTNKQDKTGRIDDDYRAQTDKARQELFIQQGRKTQVRTIKDRTDNSAQVKITRQQKRQDNRNRKLSAEKAMGDKTFKIKQETLTQTTTGCWDTSSFSTECRENWRCTADVTDLI